MKTIISWLLTSAAIVATKEIIVLIAGSVSIIYTLIQIYLLLKRGRVKKDSLE